MSNSSEPLYLTLDKDRREKVVKVASLSTHLVGGPTRVFTSVGSPRVSVKGASAYPGVIITTCTSHLGTVERVTRLLSKSTTEFPVIHSA